MQQRLVEENAPSVGSARFSSPKTRPLAANPRECRRFSHTWKSHRRDRTGWLGRQDSNLGMAESKSKIRKRPLICKGFPVSCCIGVALGKECAPCAPNPRYDPVDLIRSPMTAAPR